MRYRLLPLLAVPLAVAAPRPGVAQTPPVVTALRAEYRVDPIGIDVRQPRLSWQLSSPERGVVQTAYQIRVATAETAFGKPIWDSGRVMAAASTNRIYVGTALESGQRYWWQVRVWDGNGRPSAWSRTAFWEMGLLQPSDWRADWISPPVADDTVRRRPGPLLRKSFALRDGIRSARLYATALGLYELRLNGLRVGDQVLTPGWTSYDTRLQYQTYDVTPLLHAGENALGALLGTGWFRGDLAWEGNRNIYGRQAALLAQLHVRYADGTEQVVATDTTWKTSLGPIRWSELYDGEYYDARREPAGWSGPGFDDSAWQPVLRLEHRKDILVAPAGPPVRRIGEIRPIAILTTPAGDTVFDMGQNLVGWARLRARGAPGTTITLRHAEVLDKQGNLYTRNLRGADQQVTYVLQGSGEETLEPHFTFQGFRYVAVTGLPAPPTLDQLTGIVIHSDLTPTGRFETSSPLLNQLQHNIVWGQKGNFVDVPTDCPQRDERLGWTGDAQVFARTAAFNMDVAGFFTKWLADLAADQKPNGAVPHVIPDVLTHGRETGGGATGWADAAIIIPWTMYLVYGDTRLLQQQYPSMKAWVEYMRREAGESFIWKTGSHYGDWLAYATTRSDYPGATTDKDLLATAHFAYSAELLGRMAGVLGNEADARTYAQLRNSVQAAFLKEFVTPGGRLASNTQTAYAIALAFGLVPEALRAQAAKRLADDVRNFDNHLTTGFQGTPYLTRTLGDYGYLDVAYALLNQQTYPSWLYPVTRGATTIWERWDGIRPDSTFQDPGMNSFNHYAYGAIGAWLYSVVAGIDIDPEQPGYQHSLLQPRPGGGLTSAAASIESMYGTVASAWRLDGTAFTYDVTVPANTRATVRLPGATLAAVLESGRPLAGARGVSAPRQDGGAVVLDVGSGTYRFTYQMAVH
ncbi:MAG: alpha-L-rhamnosidase [Gemmatimonadetes bacterium]|nr:alpha-L-rhamnosidase [Gemmatimonadota bacterium]